MNTEPSLDLITPWPVMNSFSPNTGNAGNRNVGSGATLTANKAYAVWFRILKPWEVKSVWAYTGTSYGGNWDVGVYTLSGKKLLTGGSSAATSANDVHINALGTSVMVGPGLFYMVFATDSGSYDWYCNSSNCPGVCQMCGCVEQASAWSSGLPSSLTLATSTEDTFPIFGISTLTSF